MSSLQDIAQQMVARGKGILAIDESMGTCEKRFTPLGIEFSEEKRRQYRELLVTAEGIENSVAGFILFDETLRQSTTNGVPFAKALKSKGIIPGIKLDTGAMELALHSGEKVTEGLDGLRGRIKEYKKLGAEFAKWRAVITIKGNTLPSQACYEANAHALARYAALCQEGGLVPMVEPEVLIDGDHDIERCYEVTSTILQTLFAQLEIQGVDPTGTILKTSMVLSGKDCKEQADLATVAEMTVSCLTKNVPHDLAGVVFLSGGQSDLDSTLRLNEMNKAHGDKLPWPLSFSFGRSIQRPALEQWKGDSSKENVQSAQAKLVHRANMNGLAATGEYTEEAENNG